MGCLPNRLIFHRPGAICMTDCKLEWLPNQPVQMDCEQWESITDSPRTASPLLGTHKAQTPHLSCCFHLGNVWCTHPTHIFVLLNSLSFSVQNPGMDTYSSMWKIKLLPVYAWENEFFFITGVQLAFIWAQWPHRHDQGWPWSDTLQVRISKGSPILCFPVSHLQSIRWSCSSESAPAQFNNGIFNFSVLIRVHESLLCFS